MLIAISSDRSAVAPLHTLAVTFREAPEARSAAPSSFVASEPEEAVPGMIRVVDGSPCAGCPALYRLLTSDAAGVGQPPAETP